MRGEGEIKLQEAVKFHGHLGPYLVLGLLAGQRALKELKCKKYFGLNVLAWGATRKPRSCLIDGLQLSCGATYGKGNIRKLAGPAIKIEFSNISTRKKIVFNLNKDLVQELNSVKTHKDSELLARRLYKVNPLKIFKLTTGE
ncbi:MAG: formylmethanofuran dehydrogenase subunit E family protein [Candidatus Omnitrophica bacterium]|nr:formylmethanofuran dehydrogenase subunit E family protein [Candidatus Omnitrophota bacterium]